MKYKVLLLDLDGTLLGSRQAQLVYKFSRHFIRSLMSRNVSFPRALKTLHFQKKKMLRQDHQKSGALNIDKSVEFFKDLSGIQTEDTKQFLSKLSIECFQFAESAFYQIPEAQEFCNWAQKKFKLILATNPMWPPAAVTYRLGKSGIPSQIFSFITHAENMSTCKPHVAYYQELIEKCQLHPTECLMIGNDPIKDGPAKAVGIEVFLIKKPSDFKKLRQFLEENV